MNWQRNSEKFKDLDSFKQKIIKLSERNKWLMNEKWEVNERQVNNDRKFWSPRAQTQLNFQAGLEMEKSIQWKFI